MPSDEFQIDDFIEYHFQTHRFDTGTLTDADSLPTWRIYEENNDTATTNSNAVKRDDANTIGYYYARSQASAANGFEEGKDYIVRAEATVNAIKGADVIGRFRVVTAPILRSGTGAGQVEVDGSGVLVNVGTTTTATDVTNQVSADVTAISGGSGAAGNLEADYDGTGYTKSKSVLSTVTNVTNEVTADMTKISGDQTAADNFETMLDGTGGKKLTLEQLRIDSSSAGGALDIDNSAGPGISATGGNDGHGMELAGNGSGEGLSATGGATGNGIQAKGGSSSGDGFAAQAQGSGDGMQGVGTSGGHGMKLLGNGTGEGLSATGGTTGSGIEAIGGASAGHGLYARSSNISSHGILGEAASGAGAGAGIRAVDADAGTAELGAMDANIDLILADTGSDGVVIASNQVVATTTDVTNDVTHGASERTSIADALLVRALSAIEDSAGHGSVGQVFALVGGAFKVTLTDDGDGTGTMKLFKADGSTQWGNDLGVTTTSSGDLVTGAEDTVS